MKTVRKIKVYNSPPEGFQPRLEAACCFIQVQGKFLLLRAAAHKAEPGTWGLPGGKLELHEVAEAAMQREVYEETGIRIGNSNSIKLIQTVYVRKPEIDYTFHMYAYQLPDFPSVQLSNEHDSYAWVTLDESRSMPIMEAGHDALEFFPGR